MDEGHAGRNIIIYGEITLEKKEQVRKGNCGTRAEYSILL